MPYPRTLHEYVLPEFFREAPDAWVKRLREISPITETLSHLAFRWWEPCDSRGHDHGWLHPERGVWSLYSMTPRKMVHPEKINQLEKHWSELHETERAGRRAMVSDYQHFIWHTQGYLAQPFWILQGEWGGTPAKYSQREIRYLDASGAVSDPFPLGFFPAAPFDERVIGMVLKRDRLVQACNRYDELEKLDRPLEQRVEDEAAERLFRTTYLETWSEIMRPTVEFMQSTLGKAHAEHDLPAAPEGITNTVAQWKDHWVETGKVIGVKAAQHRAVQVAVA